jgi:hypothetical protein
MKTIYVNSVIGCSFVTVGTEQFFFRTKEQAEEFATWMGTNSLNEPRKVGIKSTKRGAKLGHMNAVK